VLESLFREENEGETRVVSLTTPSMQRRRVRLHANFTANNDEVELFDNTNVRSASVQAETAVAPAVVPTVVRLRDIANLPQQQKQQGQPCAPRQLHVPPAMTALSSDAHKENGGEDEENVNGVALHTSARHCARQRVQVWVPRRVEALCEPRAVPTAVPSSSPSSSPETTHDTPQPLIWQRVLLSTDPQRQQEGNNGAESLLARQRAPSPLSSTQWCVTAFECVDVYTFTAAASTSRLSAGDYTTRHPLMDGSHNSGNDITGRRVDSCEDAEDAAAVPSGLPSAPPFRTAAGSAHTTISVSQSQQEAEDVDDDGGAAGGGGSGLCRVACGCRRPRHSSSSGGGSGGSCCVQRVESAGGNVAFSTCYDAIGGSSVPLLRLQGRRPFEEVHITLSWLLHTSALPPPAARQLTRCLEDYIDACLSSQGVRCEASLQQQQVSWQRISPPSPPLPFWIAAFAYTRSIQTHTTLYASRAVHEAEVVRWSPSNARARHRSASPRQKTDCNAAALERGSAAVGSVPWPQWVPSVQWGTQVLAALTSAAFVLINDVAQALQDATAATTDTVAAAAEKEALLRIASEFRVFCEAVFGDAERKKLCRHVRDRLPVHIDDLRELLTRPRCRTGLVTLAAPFTQYSRTFSSAANARDETGHHEGGGFADADVSAADRQEQQQPVYNTTATSTSVSATRCPSMLDLVHHLAFAWLRQCFPALARRLHVFLISHDPGVVVDRWNSSVRSPQQHQHGAPAVAKSTSMTASEAVSVSRAFSNNYHHKDDAAVATRAELHNAVYDVIHDFVHGVLHRWESFSVDEAAAAISAASVTGKSSSTTNTSAPSTLPSLWHALRLRLDHGPHGDGGVGLQWRAHVNYAKTQALQCLLQHDAYHALRCDGSRVAVKVVATPSVPDSSARDRACHVRSSATPSTTASPHPPAAVDVVVDMAAVLEHLSVLPALLESSLLPQEIHGGLRRACAAAREGNDEADAFHACFRVFFAMACYGAAMLSDDDVAVATTSSSSVASNHEAVSKLWREWILPLLVGYYAAATTTTTTRSAEAPATIPGRTIEAEADSVATPTASAKALVATSLSLHTPLQPLGVLAVADQVVLYALALLQVVREALQHSTPADVTSHLNSCRRPNAASRKRHRHSSSAGMTPHHQPARQRRRLAAAAAVPDEATTVLCDAALQHDCVEVDMNDADSSSLRSPCSVSSYTTASTTATASLACCSRTIRCAAAASAEEEQEGQAKSCVPAERTEALQGLRDSTESTVPQGSPVAWVIPSLRTCTAPQIAAQAGRSFHTETANAAAQHAGAPAAAGWQKACRALAQKWLSQPSYPLSRQLPPPRPVHVIHRRDVRHLRAFLLCLRCCVQQVQLQEQQLSSCAETARVQASVSGSSTPVFRGLYDYLYGVLPPGLRPGDGGVMVVELPASMSSPSSSSSSSFHPMGSDGSSRTALTTKTQAVRTQSLHTTRGRSGHDVEDADCDEDGPLHLTSTDSLSPSSRGSADARQAEDEGDDATEHATQLHDHLSTPSTSTTLVSTLSVASSSPTHFSAEC
jgi:hypothetical protein